MRTITFFFAAYFFFFINLLAVEFIFFCRCWECHILSFFYSQFVWQMWENSIKCSDCSQSKRPHFAHHLFSSRFVTLMWHSVWLTQAENIRMKKFWILIRTEKFGRMTIDEMKMVKKKWRRERDETEWNDLNRDKLEIRESLGTNIVRSAFDIQTMALFARKIIKNGK